MKKANITKEEYLALRASGKNRKDIAKAKGYTLVHLESYWLKKWGIRDPQQEEIAILESTRVYAPEPTEMPIEPNPEQVTGLNQINAEREIADLKAAAAHWQEVAQRKDAEIERLGAELATCLESAASWKSTADEYREASIRADAKHDELWNRFVDLRESNDRLRAQLQAAEGYAEGVPAEPRIVSAFERIGQEVGELVAEKNAAYGDSFAKAGSFLRLLYPNGIGPEQYADSLCIIRIFDKLMRIATRKEAFGESPYRDIAGYGILGAQMEREADAG